MGILNAKQKKVLFDTGFLPQEIDEFDDARTPDGKLQDLAFDSAPFRAMRESRTKWILKLKKSGWNNRQIVEQIKRYYRLKAGRSPFDFLKIEYQPPKKLTDFAEAVKLKVRSRVSRTLGKQYGRRMAPRKAPRFLPKRMSLPLRPAR